MKIVLYVKETASDKVKLFALVKDILAFFIILDLIFVSVIWKGNRFRQKISEIEIDAKTKQDVHVINSNDKQCIWCILCVFMVIW